MALSPEEKAEVKRGVMALKVLSVAVPLAIAVAAVYTLSVCDALLSSKAYLLAQPEYRVRIRAVDIRLVTYLVVEKIYLTEPLPLRVGGNVVTLPRGTQIRIGLEYLSWLPFLVALSSTLTLASAKLYRIVSNRELLLKYAKPSAGASRYSKRDIAIALTLTLTFFASVYIRGNAYWPLTLVYPLVDLGREAYLAPSGALLTHGYVASLLVATACLLVSATSIGLIIYSMGKGAELYWLKRNT